MPTFDVDRTKAAVFDTVDDARAIKHHFSPRLAHCIVCELTDDGREIPA
jgi:hypothetical protein